MLSILTVKRTPSHAPHTTTTTTIITRNVVITAFRFVTNNKKRNYGVETHHGGRPVIRLTQLGGNIRNNITTRRQYLGLVQQ